MENIFESFYKDAEKRPTYVAAGISLDLAKNIEMLMDEQGITSSELAARLSCKNPYITKLLRGDENLTLRSLSKIAIALDAEIKTVLINKSKIRALEKQLNAFVMYEAKQKAAEKIKKTWVESVVPSNDDAYARLKFDKRVTNVNACNA